MWSRLRESSTHQGASHAAKPTYFPAYLYLAKFNHVHTHLEPLYLERLVPDDGTAELEIVALANPEEPLRVSLHIRRDSAAPDEYRAI